MKEQSESPRLDEFVLLYSTHHPGVYSYVLTLVGQEADAEEVLQESITRAWESFGSFEPNSDFRAWLKKIAFHQVLALRKRRKRLPLSLSTQALQEIAELHESHYSTLESEGLSALRECLRALRTDDRQTISACYQPGVKTADVASELGRPASTVYKHLSRIRSRLLNCINGKLSPGVGS